MFDTTKSKSSELKMHTVLWKRVDREGYDACRFKNDAGNWTIEGSAIFDQDGKVANLSYRLLCDRHWVSRKASVSGWVGDSNVKLIIERRQSTRWLINGVIDESLNGLKDVDFGFTPATNTVAIRRLNPPLEEEALSVAVWLDTDDWTIKSLPQSYRRIRANAFAYASPRHDFCTTLTVNDFGTVTDYPDLWVMLRNDLNC